MVAEPTATSSERLPRLALMSEIPASLPLCSVAVFPRAPVGSFLDSDLHPAREWHRFAGDGWSLSRYTHHDDAPLTAGLRGVERTEMREEL